jgi:hypothetical protein
MAKYVSVIEEHKHDLQLAAAALAGSGVTALGIQAYLYRQGISSTVHDNKSTIPADHVHHELKA